MFKRDNNAGLYLTIAVHLLVLIVLLLMKIGFTLREEVSFILDFTRQEEVEQKAKELQFKEDISKELDDILAGRTAVRNVVVDASEKGNRLKDDRFKNPSQVYEEAKALQEKLNASKKEAEANQGVDEPVSGNNTKETKTETYRGPSVISYSLDGRKSISLPIPVYKCIGGGDVSVVIYVNRKGYVTGASVIENASSSDPCLREYAIRAARSSRFTASSTAPDKQAGEIVYRFIAQ